VNNIQIVQTCCKQKLGNVEGPLHQIDILKIHILNVYGQTDITILLNHVVFCLSYMIYWATYAPITLLPY